MPFARGSRSSVYTYISWGPVTLLDSTSQRLYLLVLPLNSGDQFCFNTPS